MSGSSPMPGSPHRAVSAAVASRRSAGCSLLAPARKRMPTCLGGIRLADHRRLPIRRRRQIAIERPKQGARPQGGPHDLLPTGDGSLADLLGPKGPEQATGGIAIRGGPFALAHRQVHALHAQAGQQVRLPGGRRGYAGIEGPMQRDVGRMLGHLVEAVPVAGPEVLEGIAEAIETGLPAERGRDADQEVEAGRGRAGASEQVAYEPVGRPHRTRRPHDPAGVGPARFHGPAPRRGDAPVGMDEAVEHPSAARTSARSRRGSA